jgi:small subunit ribosomal protein S6
MPSHVGQYEALFLLNANYATGSWDAARGEVEHILHRANAEILHLRKWDERRLAFEIDGQKRGVYVLAFFKCDTSKVVGIERDVQLSENMMRVLVLRSDHLALKDIEEMQPQQPSAEEHDTRSFRRGPREERGPREDRGGREPRGEKPDAGDEADAETADVE